MNVFLYLVIPMLVAALAQYSLTLLWPKVPGTEAPGSHRGDRGDQSKPAVKAVAESDIVDRGQRMVREQARKEERTAVAAAVPEPEPFQLPSDFDIAEYSSHRE